jgi:hypothetical protein
MGFELRFASARQVLYHLSHASSPFCSGYFGDRALHFTRPACSVIVLFYASCCSWDDRHAALHIAFFFLIEMESRKLFLLGWPGTMIFLISFSHVDKIMGFWICVTFFFFFWQHWDLNSGCHACLAGTLTAWATLLFLCVTFLNTTSCVLNPYLQWINKNLDQGWSVGWWSPYYLQDSKVGV